MVPEIQRLPPVRVGSIRKRACPFPANPPVNLIERAWRETRGLVDPRRLESPEGSLVKTILWCSKCYSVISEENLHGWYCFWCKLTHAGVVPPYREAPTGGESCTEPVGLPDSIDITVGTYHYLSRWYPVEDETPWQSLAIRSWEDEDG